MAPHPTLCTCSRLRALQPPSGSPIWILQSQRMRSGATRVSPGQGRQKQCLALGLWCEGGESLSLTERVGGGFRPQARPLSTRVQLPERFSTAHSQARSPPPSNLQVWRLRDQGKQLCSSPGGASPSVWPAARVRSRGARPNLSLSRGQRTGGRSFLPHPLCKGRSADGRRHP